MHLTTILHLGSICETLGHTWLDWEGLGSEKLLMFTEHYCLPQELIVHFLMADIMELQGAIGEVMDLRVMPACQVCIEHWTIISVSL